MFWYRVFLQLRKNVAVVPVILDSDTDCSWCPPPMLSILTWTQQSRSSGPDGVPEVVVLVLRRHVHIVVEE
jgi:hypothetical protein